MALPAVVGSLVLLAVIGEDGFDECLNGGFADCDFDDPPCVAEDVDLARIFGLFRYKSS